jgi:hypothetical protein
MNYKIGYSFDPESKRYIVPERVYVEKKTGAYPCAANVVFKAPPATRENEGAYWNGHGWDTRPDEGFIEKDGQIRKMTQAERIEAGLAELPEGFKIKDGELVEKTYDELLEAGKITLAEYNEHQRLMREGTYKATTDKIGLMVLRGEATMEEWQAAIQAVKEQYPYKEDIK